MQIDQLSPRERLKHWREFRQRGLNKDQSDEEQLLVAAGYWNDYPFVNQYFNPDDPINWPTPWEVINAGQICSVSKPYMIEQTLLMGTNRWIPERLQLLYVDCKAISAMFMILVVDAKYVLNYSQNELKYFDNIIKDCIIQNKYSPSNHYRHKLI